MSMRPALAAVLALLAATPARAETLVEPATEVAFEANPTYQGKRFACLGTGLRKKAIFKVYAVAFCVEEAALGSQLDLWFHGPGRRHEALRGDALGEALERDPEFFDALLALPADKAVEMAFVREVSRERIKDAFTDSLVRAMGDSLRPRIEAFVGNLHRGMGKGERLVLDARVDGAVSVILSDREQDLRDEAIAKALWVPYLGRDSIMPGLKKSVAQGVAQWRTRQLAQGPSWATRTPAR